MDEILSNIERLRIFRGYSKRFLAKKANITPEYYWKLINGKAPGCAYSIIQDLMKSVDLKIVVYLDLDKLIGENENKTTEDKDKRDK